MNTNNLRIEPIAIQIYGRNQKPSGTDEVFIVDAFNHVYGPKIYGTDIYKEHDGKTWKQMGTDKHKFYVFPVAIRIRPSIKIVIGMEVGNGLDCIVHQHETNKFGIEKDSARAALRDVFKAVEFDVPMPDRILRLKDTREDWLAYKGGTNPRNVYMALHWDAWKRKKLGFHEIAQELGKMGFEVKADGVRRAAQQRGLSL